VPLVGHSPRRLRSDRPHKKGLKMNEPNYIDIDIVAAIEEDDYDDYLVLIPKKELNRLISLSNVVVRHWDGMKPVLLRPYGEDAVRTAEDASADNNLDSLPRVTEKDLHNFLG
jgi:hypothetical protein